jgi:hypothetical protein
MMVSMIYLFYGARTWQVNNKNINFKILPMHKADGIYAGNLVIWKFVYWSGKP